MGENKDIAVAEQAPKKEVLVSKLMERRLEQPPIDYSQMVLDNLEKKPLSYSSLKHFSVSPWHYWNYYFGEKKESDAFDKGKVFELMLLEPEKVDTEIRIRPDLNLRKPADREKLAEWKIDPKNAGKIHVSESDLAECLEMYERCMRDEELMEFLSDIEKDGIQETVYWTDPETKLRNVAKIDCRNDKYANPFKVIDIKTGISGDPLDWDRAVLNFYYHLQAGGYTLAYEKKYFVYPQYYWVVVENRAPYAINIFKADDRLLEEGKRLYLQLLQAFKYCLDNNLWHQSHAFWRFLAPYNNVRMPGYYKTKI